MKIGALIIAGGKSTRMGTDKAALKYGEDSFVRHLTKTLSDYDELLLSLADGSHQRFGLCAVYDVYAGCGPMGGLHAALSSCRSDALLTVPCDTPLFSAALGKHLCSLLTDTVDAVVPLADGRLHTLCAVYRKSTAPVFETLLKQGNFRMRAALNQLNVRYVDIEKAGFSAQCLKNINTRREYDELIQKFLNKTGAGNRQEP